MLLLLLLLLLLLFLLLLLCLMLTCEQHTYTSSEHFHLEEGETMLARGNENIRAPGDNRTRDLPNPVKQTGTPWWEF